jgi:alpha-tubulin suppressor-like RCC1 family protein
MHGRRRSRAGEKSNSYVEVRMMCFLGVGILLLAVALPALIWASDWEGDNLPDSWKAHYGLSTNVYDPADLVGWWQMEPNTNYLVLDRWTNEINGSLINFPTNPYVTGIFSNALAFPTNAQVNFGTNAALNSTTNQFTFSAWFQTTTNATQTATIAAWADGQTNSWSVGADTNGEAFITFSNSSGAVQTVEPATNGIPIYDGSWHQVAATYDTNQVATVYVDGESQASGTITNWSGGPEASFTFGVTNTNSVNPAFTLDETRLYSRALGPDEVTQLPFTYSDLNGSGLTIYDDYLEGLNPLSTNEVVTPGFIDSGLTGYYGSTLPTLTKSSGDAQTVCASNFEANPLVVQVTDGSGTPLTNAPITFAIAHGSHGGLSQTSGGTTTASISLTTDSDGNATIYYQAGADTLRDNIISATAVTNAGNVSVAFTAYCGIQNGLGLWLKSEAGVTQDGSGNVSLWADQGVNHNDVSQTTTGEYPVFATNQVNGKPVLTFNGSQYLAANDASTLDPSNITMIVVGQYSASSNNYGSFISKTTSSEQIDGYGMGILGGPVGGWVDNYSSGAAQGTVVSGQYGTMSFTYDQSNVIFRLNGQTLATEPYTSAINNVSGVPLLIGTTDTSFYYPLTGSIAEVLIYDRVLSSSELQEVEVYLADKYGLYNPDATWISAYSSDVQAEINANEWNKAQADAYVAFLDTSPSVPATGLLLWLNAGSGVTTDSSNNVLQWVDQGPFGHVAAQSTEISPPVLQTDSSGNPTLSFNGSQALYCPDYVTANNDLTIISIASLANTGNFNMDLTIGGVTNEGGVRSYANYYGSAEFDLYYASASAGPSANPNEQAINTVTYSRESGAINFYLRGNYNGYGNATATDLSSGFWVGDSVDLACPWQGTISEVLVYDHVLSDTERNEAEGYLADKYGLYQPTATWQLAYAADIQELITENEWSKAETDAYVSSLATAVGAPVLSPPPGHYSSSQTVTVTSDTSDATIYYTTDGTTPTTGSTSVSNGGEITVSATTQIQLLAADGTLSNSPITSAVYRIGNSGNLVAGDSFTMVNKPDGTVWTWGDDSRGQQGDDQANNPAAVPQEVPDISGVTAVAAAGDHALAVTSDGSVWAWGADDVSQSGDGGTTDLLVPTEISGLSNIISVYAGQLNGFAVDNSGNLYAWGDNTNGQLGDGTNNSESAPEAITSVTGVTKIASSPNFTLALKSDGTVWATGSNADGELGDGTQNDENFFQQVPNLSGVVDIAIGSGHALALLSNGTVWSWGYGGDGELGNGNYNSSSFPQQILGLPAAVAVEAVNSQSFVILADGTIRCFGYDGQGQLGMGATVQDQTTPVTPAGVGNVLLLAAGSYHTVICTSTGAFYGWGDNTRYRVGEDYSLDTNESSYTETHDTIWQGFTSVVSAETSTLGLKNDGTVWGVGEGDNGVLGQGDWYPSERPIQAIGLTDVTQLAAGYQIAFAIRSDGTLWSWGQNWNGQLASGNYNFENAPTQITSLSGVTSVTGGDNHMLAIQSDGTVWASGDDSQGELGDGTTNQEDAPIEVFGLTDPIQVAAGNDTSFVLQSDGSVWAWGQNDMGQLGLGLIGNVQTPTQITSLPPMVAISVHETNGVGIDTSGNVWNWGPILGNSDGSPLEQTGVSNVTSVAAGSYHDLAIASDGSLWGNGSDWNGQLGGVLYGTTSTFIQFSDIQGATGIAANDASTLILKQDGSISGYGNFNNGQLAANLGVYITLPQHLFGIAMAESPPTISITSPSSGATGTMGNAIDFQSSASASAGSIAEVDYYLNGVEIGSSTSGGTWEFTWVPPTYGDLTFEAVAIDSAGVAQISSPITLGVATAPAGSPTNVRATSGPSGTVYLGWTNTSTTATSILIQEQNSDGSWTTLATLSDPTTTSYAVTGLTSGQTYTFQVVAATDGTGPATSVVYSPTSTNLPILTKASGDGQSVAASTFATNPLVVQVKDVAGNSLINVPVAFALASGSDGGLALTSGGDVSSTQSVSTNAEGQATVYYESGSDAIKNNTITATIVSGSINLSTNFTAYCGVQNGLAAWFRGDLGVTTSGGSVTQWTDQSSNQYNVTQTAGDNAPTVGTDATSGLPVLAFNGSQYLADAGDQTAVTNDVTIITVASATAPTATATQLVVGNATDGTEARALATDSSSQSFNNGDTFADGGPVALGAGLNINTMTYSESGSLASFYSQGVANGTASLSATDVSSGLTIGSLLYYGPYLSWNGNIAEVLVFNRILTTSEREQIELYLANKYQIYAPGASWISSYSSAVQTEINRNHWSNQQATAYVAFQAANPDVLTTGLEAWYKADSGVTLGIGSNVISWADQTGNNNLSQQAELGQPTLIASDSNGEPGLRFGGSQSLTSPNSLGVGVNADMTIVAVGMTTTPANQQYSLYLGNGTAGETRALGYQSSNEFFDATGSSASGAAAPSANAFATEAASINSTLTSVTFYQNGVQTATGSISGLSNPSNGISLGTAWQGDISEVLVYDHQLSSSELQEVGVYLADKYGLYNPNATWPEAYSSDVQTLITANQWSKSQADTYVAVSGTLPVVSGLTAWFRADSGVETASSLGQSVDIWKDSSWNQNDVSQTTASNEPTLGVDPGTGKPTVQFNGSEYLAHNNYYPSLNDITIVTIASSPTLSSAIEGQVAFGSEATQRGLLYNGGYEAFSDAYHTYFDGGSAPSTSSLVTSAVTYSSATGTANFYSNGSANGSASASSFAITRGLAIGSMANLSPFNAWNGNISEILIYNRVLTSTELGEIQTYLTTKYAAYADAAPTISPDGGSYSGTTSVTLSGATSGQVICYTLDGSVPTGSSPEYTTTLSLTADSIVNCAIFQDGVQVSPEATADFWIGDTDHLGIPDSWQIEYFGAIGIDPNAQSPGGSGLTNLQAYQWGYNPTMYSTNGDGLSDLVNHELGYAGDDDDINGYGLTNAQQLALGLDPFDVGVNPPLPTPPSTDPSDHTAPVINLTQPANATLLP